MLHAKTTPVKCRKCGKMDFWIFPFSYILFSFTDEGEFFLDSVGDDDAKCQCSNCTEPVPDEDRKHILSSAFEVDVPVLCIARDGELRQAIICEDVRHAKETFRQITGFEPGADVESDSEAFVYEKSRMLYAKIPRHVISKLLFDAR